MLHPTKKKKRINNRVLKSILIYKLEPIINLSELIRVKLTEKVFNEVQ